MFSNVIHFQVPSTGGTEDVKQDQHQPSVKPSDNRSDQLGIDGEALVNLPPELPIVIDEQAVEDILGVRLHCMFTK